eukprot:697774-Pyramimonas_sp.AAC.2
MDGRGHCTYPNTTPYREQLTQKDYDHATAEEIVHASLVGKNLVPTHYLVQFNRGWHAGNPADHKSEEEGQQEAGEDEDDEMAEEVDPTDAAPEGYESSTSGITDVACQTDTSTDPNYFVTEDVGLSPGRRIAHRARSVG